MNSLTPWIRAFGIKITSIKVLFLWIHIFLLKEMALSGVILILMSAVFMGTYAGKNGFRIHLFIFYYEITVYIRSQFE